MQIKSQMFYTQINLFCNSVLHKLLETPECSLLSKQEISSSPTCSQLFSSLLFPWRWCILGRTRADRFSKPEESIRCAMSWRAQRSLLSPEETATEVDTSTRPCCQWHINMLGSAACGCAVSGHINVWVYHLGTWPCCPKALMFSLRWLEINVLILSKQWASLHTRLPSKP